MSSNLAAVIRWFPSQKQAIEERAARDESFRSICEDLADAESALQKLENSQSPKRDQRCSEYRELVDSLAKERSPLHFQGNELAGYLGEVIAEAAIDFTNFCNGMVNG